MRLNKVILIRISEQEKQAIAEQADKEGFSVSLLIKRLIRAYLKTQVSTEPTTTL